MPRLLASISSVRHRAHDGSTRIGERHHTIGVVAFIVLAGSGALGAFLSATRLDRIEVVGPSMVPTLDDGDRVVVWATKALRLGDLIVFRDPADESRHLVKRLVGLGEDELIVAGDNAGVSRDSRSFGAIEERSVIGVVVYRYFPPERAGRFPRPARANTGALQEL